MIRKSIDPSLPQKVHDLRWHKSVEKIMWGKESVTMLAPKSFAGVALKVKPSQRSALPKNFWQIILRSLLTNGCDRIFFLFPKFENAKNSGNSRARCLTNPCNQHTSEHRGLAQKIMFWAFFFKTHNGPNSWTDKFYWLFFWHSVAKAIIQRRL